MRNLKVLPAEAGGYPLTGVGTTAQPGHMLSWSPSGVTLGGVSQRPDGSLFTFGTAPHSLAPAGRP